MTFWKPTDAQLSDIEKLSEDVRKLTGAAKPKPRLKLDAAGSASIRGTITMLENGHPLTDEIQDAIARLVSAAARAARRTRT